jgi:sigma-B regulation protein RsbU (phosphoserine phosphatase)
MKPHRVPPTWLIAIDGPPLSALALKGPPHGITLGRNEQCDVCMPANAEGVSRRHARMRWEADKWLLADLNSRWGTHLNGTRLPPETEVPVAEADLIGIGPWTLKLSSQPQIRGLQSKDDVGHSIITSPDQQNVRPLAENLLKLLLNGAAKIYAAKSEVELATEIIAVAQAGTGLRQAVVLRPSDGSGGIEIIANSLAASDARGPQQFSRSLIAAAAKGGVAELCENESEEYGNSIAQLNITCAICVPLMLGERPAAFLYLDSRGGRMQTLSPQASAFCAALGTMASLALANLKRMELEKREAAFRAEMNTAAAAQRWIMPQRAGKFGRFITLGESRPGQMVGGDFFDLVDLGDGRLAVVLGDVSGKGVGASVLMTAAQGFFHAAITRHGEPGQAVTDLNHFVMPRRPEDRFLTMWVGVFDLERGTIRYVDAGHGYAIKKRGNHVVQLNEGLGMPIGISAEKYEAESIDLTSDDEVMIVSDGFVEQPSLSETREEFGLQGVQRALCECNGDDPVEASFRALITHAGSKRLADDATAVLIRCCGK